VVDRLKHKQYHSNAEKLDILSNVVEKLNIIHFLQSNYLQFTRISNRNRRTTAVGRRCVLFILTNAPSLTIIQHWNCLSAYSLYHKNTFMQ